MNVQQSNEVLSFTAKRGPKQDSNYNTLIERKMLRCAENYDGKCLA